ncbi:MAG: dihydropteroate synthase [Acidimicrobiia bacterium]|nr:dihydropteroate synthase [Acidimicrobiia bacterium]
MGIVNVTPDSFSDGGVHADTESAVRAGLAMVDAGAAIVDVGGESTRPGSAGVSDDEEIARVVPVIRDLVGQGVIVSVDTSKPAVAARALDAGAHIVNDVTGLGDRDMTELVARSGVGVVVMHMLGTPRTMQTNPVYDDVVAEVLDFVVDRASAAIEVGVDPSAIAIDPGIGFGKTVDHNLALLRAIPHFVDTGFPVVIGASRKQFLGSILAPIRGSTEATARDAATLGVVAFAVDRGAQVHRVHDVTRGVEVARVVDTMVTLGSGAYGA